MPIRCSQCVCEVSKVSKCFFQVPFECLFRVMKATTFVGLRLLLIHFQFYRCLNCHVCQHVCQLSQVSTIYLFLNCSWVSWLNRLTCYNIAILHLLTIVIIRAVIIQHYLYCFRCRLGTYTVRSWPWTYCVSCLILVGYCRNSISTNAMSCHEQSFIK